MTEWQLLEKLPLGNFQLSEWHDNRSVSAETFERRELLSEHLKSNLSLFRRTQFSE